MASSDPAAENEVWLLPLWLSARSLPLVSRLLLVPLVPLALVSRQELLGESVDIRHVPQAGSGAKEALAASSMRMMRTTWKRKEPKKTKVFKQQWDPASLFATYTKSSAVSNPFKLVMNRYLCYLAPSQYVSLSASLSVEYSPQPYKMI